MNKALLLTSCFVLIGTLLFLDVGSPWAATTGKIVGVVRDAETGEALPGVNVILEGTTMGAATDLQGRYVILNVHPGRYTVRMSMIGYKDYRVTNVQVKIELTTTINAALQPTTIEVGEAITVVAEKPLVQKDMTSSQASISAEEIENLPVTNVEDVLAYQAGVVRDGNNFHIRGGRANEVAYWVDGVETTDAYNGETIGGRVEKEAIQEVQLVSGTFNAEYGRAMSGVIKIITKEGGSEFHGKIDTYIGDYVSKRDVYSVLTKVEPRVDPKTGKIEEVEYKENPLKGWNPTYNAEVSLSGPIPFTNKKLTFFSNGRFVSREGYLYGREWYKPYGLPGDSSLVPLDAGYNYSGLAKLSYKMPNISLNYQLMFDRAFKDRIFDRAFKYVPSALPEYHSHSLTQMLTLTHTLSSKSFYELRISHMARTSESYLYKEPSRYPWLIKVLADSVWHDELIIDPESTEGLEQLNTIKQQGREYIYFIDPNDPQGYLDPDSTQTPAPFSYLRAGTKNDHNFREYGFWDVKGDFTSQVNASNMIKAGAEFKYHSLRRDNYRPVAKKFDGYEEEIVPFLPQIPEKSSLLRDYYVRNPYEFSAYVQDKIELKDMIVNVGLRFDYFDANTTYPTDPKDPDIYNPFKLEHIYKNWQDPPDSIRQNPIKMEEYISRFEEYTPDERATFMRRDVKPKMQLSPRLGISFPITDRGILHFSYGHFLAMPALQYLYNNAQFKLRSGGGNRLLGNPDLEPERTVHYEFGLQQALTEDIAMNVSLFYKDTRGWVGASTLKNTVRPNVSYSQYENKEYSRAMGVTFDFEKRLSNNWLAKLFYSFQSAEGTYSNPEDAYHAIQNLEEPRRSLIPMDWDQRHTVNTYITYSNKGWTLTLSGNYYTGRPYTPVLVKGETVGSSAAVGWRENSARLPSLYGVDLRLLKQFQLNKIRMNLYFVIYNLFDNEGEKQVYPDTGSAKYSANFLTDFAGYSPNRVGSLADFVRRPEWFQTPREIQLGFSVQF